jgi:hypothetical protein
MRAVWDNKFHLSDTVTPGYGVGGSLADEKVNWKVKAEVPVTLTIGSDDFSAKAEGGGTSKKAESFYKASTFDVAVAPVVKAAVSFRPHAIIDLHAGVQVNVLNWTLKSATQEKKDLDPASEAQAVITSMGLSASSKAVSSDSEFTGPGMTMGAGATVFIGPCALDFVLMKGASPTVDGAIYEAVSGGLNAAVILSAKF